MMMKTMTRWATVLLVGCGDGAAGEGNDEDGGASSGSFQTGATGSGPGSSEDSGPETETSSTSDDPGGDEVTTGGASDEDSGSSSETCGDGCASDDPTVAWVVEPGVELGGGGCVDVMADGNGGAIVSLSVDPQSPLASGRVLALDEAGDVAADQAIGQRRVTGLTRVESGSFVWVDSYANVGESSFVLDDLDGEWLTNDLLALDDVTALGDGFAYTAVVNGFFPECRIRIDLGGFADSSALPCGNLDDRWRLRSTDDGLVAGLVGQSTLARVDSDGQISAYLESRFQRTMLDFAVDDQDQVWTVGIVRNPNEAGPAFGSFVARHGSDLGEDPQWEVVEQDDASYAWTTIAMWQGEPIVVGLDADAVPRVVALTSRGDERWSLTLDLSPSVVLRRADVDADGRLYLCGDRPVGRAPFGSTGPVIARIDL